MNIRKFLFPIFALIVFLPSLVFAGTILSSHNYAWSNNEGYIDFSGVTVSNTALSGSAWSKNAGWINFAPSTGGVLNDGQGNLSGNAWGANLGWINFSGTHINTTTGKFSGTATGSLIGTLTFDCPTYCDVVTDWRPASLSRNTKGGGHMILPVSGVSTVDNSSPAATSENEISLGNQNTQSGKSSLSVNKNVSNTSSSVSTLPNELFDISLEIDQSKVIGLNNLEARVKFINFGKVSTPVILTFDILDSTGKVIHTEKSTLTVQTENVFDKKFTNFNLASGKYTLRLSTLYNKSVKDTFTKPFEITGVSTTKVFQYWWLIIILVYLTAWIILKRRKNKE